MSDYFAIQDTNKAHTQWLETVALGQANANLFLERKQPMTQLDPLSDTGKWRALVRPVRTAWASKVCSKYIKSNKTSFG